MPQFPIDQKMSNRITQVLPANASPEHDSAVLGNRTGGLNHNTSDSFKK